MSDDDHLRSLDERLGAARLREQSKPVVRTDDAEARNINNGARAGLELVISILGGCALGWALDNWLGTRPWCLIVFLFLGVGAGFMSVYRITNNLGSAIGFAALQKAQKTATKPPEITDAADED